MIEREQSSETGSSGIGYEVLRYHLASDHTITSLVSTTAHNPPDRETREAVDEIAVLGHAIA